MAGNLDVELEGGAMAAEPEADEAELMDTVGRAQGDLTGVLPVLPVVLLGAPSKLDVSILASSELEG